MAARPTCMADRPKKRASRAQSSARALPYSSYKYHGAPSILSRVLGVARARKVYQNPFGFNGVFEALAR
jgi:hypothetical protein